jgi:hypothetical protein
LNGSRAEWSGRAHDSVSTTGLGEVQRGVGGSGERCGIGAVFGIGSDAEAQRHLNRPGAEAVGDMPTNPFGEQVSARGVGAWCEHSELLTADAGGEVDASNCRADRGGNVAQDLVASGMAEAVVDGLEEIDVTQEQRNGLAGPRGTLELDLQQFVECAPIP